MRRVVATFLVPLLVPLLVGLPLCPWAVVADVLAHHAPSADAATMDASDGTTTIGAAHANDPELPNFSRIARDVDVLVLLAPTAHDVALPPPPVVVTIPRSHVPAGPRPQSTAPPPPVRGPPSTLA